MKKQLWQLFKSENETGKKFKNLFAINLINCPSEFLEHIKKHLCHTGSPRNVQNNCIKLSGFGVDITRLFQHREITRNILCREKFFHPKIRSQVFSVNPTYFFHYLWFHYFRLNKTGTEVFSEYIKSYRLNSFGSVTLYM